MKKIYLTAAAFVAATGAFAQSFVQQEITSSVAKEIVFPEPSGAAATPTDTLGWDEIGTQLIAYGSQSGYVFGTNDLVNPANPSQHQYNLEYARGFVVNDAYTVVGAGFIFGAKEDVSGSPAAVTARLYSVSDNRALEDLQTASLTAPGPAAAVMASGDIAFADADTVFPNVTWVDFDSEAWVPSDFAISLDISALYGSPADTLVVLADEDGDSDGDYTWTRIAASPAAPNGQKFWAKTTAMLQGGLDVNLAMFAVVAESGVGIEEQAYMNGVKATTYPNPALSSDNITIQYAIEKAAKNVELSIYNMNGQVVFTVAAGSKASGVYNVSVPAGKLSAGTYTYLVQADDARIAKRIQVLK
ncbi:MAG: T9SS type A sorting domain-containing protein [Flavobacteriales bacterium]